MTKIKSLLAVLVLSLLSLAGYLFYSITIYATPYVTFTAPNSRFFQTTLPHCSQSSVTVPPLSQTRFRLLVWNLHKGKDAGWQHALEQFVKDTDFLFLQEVTNKQQLATQFSAQFPTALYTSAFDYLGEQSGVKLLAKATPDLFCAAMEKEPWILIPKVANALKFPLDNHRSLLIINLHLVNFELNPTNYRKQIEKMLELIAPHQGPIILAGDFNTWNQERLALIRQLTQQVGLQEVQYQPDVRLRFLNNPLDHVFVRGFQVIQATTLPTESSDHNPLLVELELED